LRGFLPGFYHPAGLKWVIRWKYWKEASKSL
jgi:hypothetical protein